MTADIQFINDTSITLFKDGAAATKLDQTTTHVLKTSKPACFILKVTKMVGRNEKKTKTKL